MKIQGLIAATVAPFSSNGRINTAVVPAMVDLLVADGVAGIFINGSTGEGASLTARERCELAEAYIAAAKGRLLSMVHVGHNCLEEARDSARHAEKAGAAAVGLVAPSYFKPASVKELVAFCAEVAAACPNTPFYYYHIPALTGVSFKMIDFLKEADGRIPTLAGIKFTFEDMMDFLLCREYGERKYDMLFGRDEMLLAALATGAEGAIGSTYNYSAPIYGKIIAAFRTGALEEARMWQVRATKAIQVLAKFGGACATKSFIRLRGIDCGPYRLPMRTLSSADERLLESDLRATGYFEWMQEAAR